VRHPSVRRERRVDGRCSAENANRPCNDKVRRAGETPFDFAQDKPAVRLNRWPQQVPVCRQAGLVGEKRLCRDDTLNSEASQNTKLFCMNPIANYGFIQSLKLWSRALTMVALGFTFTIAIPTWVIPFPIKLFGGGGVSSFAYWTTVPTCSEASPNPLVSVRIMRTVSWNDVRLVR
jgi:hypothetical protein